MSHPIQTASAILLLVSSGWYFSRNYDVHGLQGVRIEPRDVASANESGNGNWPKPTFPSTETFTSADVYPANEAFGTFDNQSTNTFVEPIRISSFNVQGFGRQKVDKPLVLDQIARLCRQFDIVAIQGLIGPDRDLLPRLVDTINKSGDQFEYLELVNYSERSRLGFVFNARRLQTDRRQLYRVQDPNQEIAVDPIVGWFRVRGLPTDKAWTFSLVNVFVDPSQASREVVILPQLIRAVQADGRHEDDVVIAGSFATETAVLQRLLSSVGYEPATVGFATDIYAQTAFDHILTMRGEHQEFTGRSGATDFLRLMNLSIGEAEEISDRIPVWAEFRGDEAE